MPKKVICAMSGGVDSSVAAALLKKQGFNVSGVFMKFWAAPGKKTERWNSCCSSEAEKRARSVAAILGIPFYVLNFEKEFKKRIVDSFLKEYKAGRTPNPCVVCNKEIKFGLLLEKALALNADYIATGHYVRKRGVKNKNCKLLKGKDKGKDQSYFLWQLNQKQLKRSLFPLGSFNKKGVRSLAKKFKLPVFSVPESQEVCFIQKTTNEFLSRYIKTKKGKIIGTDKKVLGQHNGVIFYTIGQRKGIRLPGGPYWVLNKDLKRNLLVVTKKEKDLFKKEVVFKNANWISGKAPKTLTKLKAKIRYGHNSSLGTIKKSNKFVFDKPQRAITPGQSIVFYKNEELLGGGVINH